MSVTAGAVNDGQPLLIMRDGDICWCAQGIEALSWGRRALILGTLALTAWFVAAQAVRQWIPGSRGRVASVAILVMVSAALLAVFALLFQDYRTTRFLSAGLACLLTGLLHAIPAGG